MFVVNFQLFVLIFLSALVFSANIYYKDLISKKLKIIDKISKEKIHKKNTPLNGGFHIIFIINFVLIFSIINNYNIDLILILLGTNIFFFIGLIDDKINLNAYLKLFITAITVIIILYTSDNLIINTIYSETFSKKYVFKISSIFFTCLCILLLINAINLADGINSLVNNMILIWLLFIQIHFNLSNYFYIILFFLGINSYFIYMGKYFLGDSGTLSLGFFVSSMLIFSYNNNLENYLSIETIFLLLMLPGIDMFRLFLKRLLKKRDPFSRDNEHLHHVLLKHFGLFYSNLIYLTLIVLPILLDYMLDLKTIFIIFVVLIIYGYFFLLNKYANRPLKT
tara:strand:- start:147 stop:1160 length:1014 start_codon:yes stop_codon:yes gene_type:complete